MSNGTTGKPQAETSGQPATVPLWEPNVDEGFLQTWQLHPHQVEAVHSLQAGARAGHRDFQVGVPTGGGRTATAAAICRLYLDTRNAGQILFLAGPEEVRAQLQQALEKEFSEEYRVSDPATDPTAQILVTATGQPGKPLDQTPEKRAELKLRILVEDGPAQATPESQHQISML